MQKPLVYFFKTKKNGNIFLYIQDPYIQKILFDEKVLLWKQNKGKIMVF